MKTKMRLLGGAFIAVLLTGVAGAAFADPNAAAKPDCFASFSSWLDSSAAACPLSAYGITFYGTIDVGGGYESHGAPFNGDAKTAVSEVISKVNNASRWQGVPSGLTQSNIGVKFREPIFDTNWFLIGDINAGFDPYSFKFANGPKSLVDNNNVALAHQSTNTDSARSTGWDNSRADVRASKVAQHRPRRPIRSARRLLRLLAARLFIDARRRHRRHRVVAI